MPNKDVTRFEVLNRYAYSLVVPLTKTERPTSYLVRLPAIGHQLGPLGHEGSAQVSAWGNCW
jgi:hypothetical protein